MKNYINLNGTKIKLTEQQVIDMQKSFGILQVKLSDVPVGDTFKIGEYEFIVLEHQGRETAVILKGLLKENQQFGKNNDFRKSYVIDVCAGFAVEIEKIIGITNVTVHAVDLTSDDGLKDYRQVLCKVSLLTTEQYRKYVNILDKHKLNKWWWLATPYSTPSHEDDSWVKCVSPYGRISDCSYNCARGVRPFCILNSDIFVS